MASRGELPTHGGIELRLCPFCGGDEPGLYHVGNWYYARCTDCDAVGPGCPSAYGAAMFWNDRAYDDERRHI